MASPLAASRAFLPCCRIREAPQADPARAWLPVPIEVTVLAFLRASAFTDTAPAAPVRSPVSRLPSITQASAQVLASNSSTVPIPLGTP